MSFESVLEQNMFRTQPEKTFVDKVMAKDDIDRIKTLIAKNDLSRSELLELMSLLSSKEAKLVNYDLELRYINMKFFVWIEEFILVAELLYDYQDDLLIWENTCKDCNMLFQKLDISKKNVFCRCPIETRKPVYVMTERQKKAIINIRRLFEHNAKFMISLYLNSARTTLSVGATGLLEVLKNKYEFAYPTNAIPQQEQRGRVVEVRQ